MRNVMAVCKYMFFEQVLQIHNIVSDLVFLLLVMRW